MFFLESKYIVSINGPVVLARGEADFAMHDMVLVGDKKILGEVIKLDKDVSTIQVYEDTVGLKIGQEVQSTGSPLSLMLGPGIVGNIFDGIARPLSVLKAHTGDYIKIGNTKESESLFNSLTKSKRILLWNTLNYDNHRGKVKPYGYFSIMNYFTWKIFTFFCFLLI